ncbi:MAG: 4-(cytidine 5'-diphospho)-2-C-methyl-D-erythritol kinase [Tannerella sp.]|jgi:4-diphosphocytidyl-2-C-methyl-D-erythritol kinase|nr:4-(cytidine 5'-diphospho)-2-C-methyl-D-erythritol kinase [Tannerella sp.]
MICFPNAKINLGLHVTGKRPDGYHNIETVFYPVPLRDALEVVRADQPSFTQCGILPDVAPENNLVMKALHALKEKHLLPSPAVYLKKNIPPGAGLGGGSADAAFMLKLLNTFAGLHLDDAELEEIAAGIGADCPFFIRNKPVLATGTGNVFESLPLSLKGYTLYIVKPDASVSTREAYRHVNPSKPARPLREIISRPVTEWREALTNDFEESIFARCPVIGEIKNRLYAEGALYASMSGSGSSVFGLFRTDKPLRFPGCFVWKGMLEQESLN